MLIKVLCVFAMGILIVSCNSNTSSSLNKTSRHLQKRTLNFYFPYNSAYALAVVLSLPLELTGRSVFVSYNFETNFYYPYYDNTNGIVPIPFTWIDEPGANSGTKHRVKLPPGYRNFNDDGEDQLKRDKNKIEEFKTGDFTRKLENVETSRKERKVSSKSKSKTADNTKSKSRKIRLINYFLSRRRFFKLIESNLDKSGLKGHDCMLRTICETSEGSIGYNNGVIGSIFEKLFLPSASKDENLPKRYYRAEQNGKSKNCGMYNIACPKSIYDFISKII